MADQILTLAQFAQLEKNPLKKGIMMGLTQESVVADIMTFRTIGGLSESGVRFDEVISPDWIPIDGTIQSKRANGKPLSFTVHQLAVHIDVPVLLEDKDENQLARLSTQNTKLAIKGAAYAVNDAFINGDHGSDPDQFEGLNKLVASLGSAQTVGATELDISAGGADSAARHNLIDRVDEALDACEGHIADGAFCNASFAKKFRSVLRREGLLGDHHNWLEEGMRATDVRKTQRTASTRPAFVYSGAGRAVPFYIIGTKADQSTDIIGNAYAEGGAAAATRVFFVKFGPDELEGLQAKGLEVKNIGLLEDKETYRKRVVWSPGMAMWGPRSVVKLQGVKVA